jgi:hypothetical protein
VADESVADLGRDEYDSSFDKPGKKRSDRRVDSTQRGSELLLNLCWALAPVAFDFERAIVPQQRGSVQRGSVSQQRGSVQISPCGISFERGGNEARRGVS